MTNSKHAESVRGGSLISSTAASRTVANRPPTATQRASDADPCERSRFGAAHLRIAAHLLLASLPLLAISAHVFGVVSMRTSAGLVVLPLCVVVAMMIICGPHVMDRVLRRGLVWGVVACLVYDAFRLDTVYLLGWWGDFIPSMGTWITGNAADRWTGAVVGYVWRFVGDGGGIGVVFFAVAATLGTQHWSRRTVVGAATAFAVVPVWTGLILTVALAPAGERLLFPLTPTTVVLSLTGHLIFGVVLGIGFWRSRDTVRHWPWTPLAGVRRPKR